MRRATSSTRSRVSGLISGLLLIARETVIFETPNSRAMSASVTGMIVLQRGILHSSNLLRYKEILMPRTRKNVADQSSKFSQEQIVRTPRFALGHFDEWIKI